MKNTGPGNSEFLQSSQNEIITKFLFKDIFPKFSPWERIHLTPLSNQLPNVKYIIILNIITNLCAVIIPFNQTIVLAPLLEKQNYVRLLILNISLYSIISDILETP